MSPSLALHAAAVPSKRPLNLLTPCFLFPALLYFPKLFSMSPILPILPACQFSQKPVVHIRTIRQSATIMSMDRPLLRTGDRSNVRFKFMYKPEYVSVGSTLLFREGRTKGMGKITRLIYPEDKRAASSQQRASGPASGAKNKSGGAKGQSSSETKNAGDIRERRVRQAKSPRRGQQLQRNSRQDASAAPQKRASKMRVMLAAVPHLSLFHLA